MPNDIAITDRNIHDTTIPTTKRKKLSLADSDIYIHVFIKSCAGAWKPARNVSSTYAHLELVSCEVT